MHEAHGGDADETLDAAADARARSSQDPGPPAFPIAAWDRYQHVKFLGQGGMGRVFHARDLRLRRDVALKFIRGGGDPELTRRFIAEARAQARVSHEHVCKIYEVGEIQGEVYIAMQYIEGDSLGAVAKELTVEQKVRLLRSAAEGVHEAHRAGIIHRDLKPSNIMIERTPEGDLKPYVMDFGLARDWNAGATETGTVLGTPQFMAPEQARGEVGRLDRRADVYSLGATLYALLTSQAPIPGSNPLEVLNNLATSEPILPRALNPDIAVDLEAIVLKCLEKDRNARYDSARALVEDLNRFLGGDPVSARPVGPYYRLRKKLEKHRRFVAVIAAALTLVLLALGWVGLTRREAAERERLARRFTELVEHIESTARYSALAPLHDTRPDQSAMRTRMDELDAEIRRGGAIAVGPGHYALGRGFLALGEEQKARESLESAWQHGFREPRAAYALALVIGHLYQEQLLEAERIQSPEQREARKRAIERSYRDPALAYLKQGEGADVPSHEYVAALLSFYEDHLDEALQHLDAVGDGLPWFYEAPELRGDILLTRAFRGRNQGQREQALADFDAGRKAYAAAAAIGRSVPVVHQAMGELEYAALVMELYGQGDVKPRFDLGIAAAKRALTALPGHYASLVLEARLRRSMAEHLENQGVKAEDLLAEAVAAAESAVAAAPSKPEARLELGRIYRQWGQARQDRNQDPREQLRKAVEIAESLGPEDRTYAFHVHLGLVFDIGAEYEGQIGGDPRTSRAKAIESYLTAIKLDDKLAEAWINLGINYFMRASDPRAPDADGDLDQATKALDQARLLDPKHTVLYYYGAEAHGLKARRQRARGGDARPDLAAALDLDRRGIAINPRLPHLHNGAGSILLEQAREAWDHGGAPDPLLAEAQTAFEQAVAAAPQQGFGQHNVGEALAQRAAYQRARGEDPGPTARAAVIAIQQAIERIPKHAPPWANLGMVYSILAAFELEQGRDPTPSLAQATAALESALERNPKSAQAYRYLGEVRATRARFKARSGKAGAEDFEAAAQAFQKAIELAPENQDQRIAYGHFCRAWASWQQEMGRDPGPALKRGLELVSAVVAARPEWPDARLLRASLVLVQVEAATSPEERREASRQAAEDFTRALAANANLGRVWRSQATRAQQLVALPP